MKEKTYKDIYDMADEMYSMAVDGKYVVATLFYEDAAELLKALVLIEDEYEISVETIELAKPEFDAYNKEYYVSLTKNDYVISLCIEKAYYRDNYLMTECDVMLIDGDANSAVLLRNEDAEFYEVSILEDGFYDDEDDDDEYEEDYCCEDCENCEYMKRYLYIVQSAFEMLDRMNVFFE